MQRINWFPDPNMANTIFRCVPVRCTVDFPTVSGFRWLRATTSASGDIYAQYELMGVNLPPAGVYHIHSVCYARGSGALFRIYAGVGNSFTLLYETGIADDQTKTIDADITIPANTTRLLIRVVPPSTVGKFILIRDILVESKSTYDTAVGGASGLLLRRHHATRLTPAAGVMQDDDNQHGQKSGSLHHRITQRGSDHSMRSVDGRRQLSGQHIRQRQRRHSLIGFANYRPINEGQLETGDDCNSDQVSSRFRRAIRHADRHRDEYAHLHVGRVSGEQGSARPAEMVRREHDAARLTLLGVMA